MRYLLPILLVLTECSFRYEATSPSDPIEEALLSETAWAAGAMGVEVHGEITDTISPAQRVVGQSDPVAWYAAGVAWYYRPQVQRYVSLTPEPYKETAKNIAVHEVCHALHRNHDLAHWECMNKWASPTYPYPANGSTASSSCFALSVDPSL